MDNEEIVRRIQENKDLSERNMARIEKLEKGQVWEFSVYTHNSKSYIIWKNWSA